MRKKLLIGTALIVGVFGVIAAVTPSVRNALISVPPQLLYDSPDATLRLNAGSFDNAPRGFPHDYRYELIDVATGKARWRRVQSDSEGAPNQAWVDDSGWVVLSTSRHKLVALDPDDGDVRVELDVLAQFPQDEQRRHVHWTTGGLMWSELSGGWFFDADGSRAFVLRTGWGRRIIVLLDEERIASNDPTLVESAMEAENEAALAYLHEILADPSPLDDQLVTQAQFDAVRAIVILAQNGVEEAIPLFRSLEQYEKPWNGASVALDKVSLHQSDRVVFWKQYVRFAAQMALRLLGERPAPLQSTDAFVYHHDHQQTRIDPVALTTDRDGQVNFVHVGTTLDQLLRTIGPPDDEYRWDFTFVWEYHVDADPPYTLRVDLDHRGTVRSRQIVDPPVWHDTAEWFELIRSPS